MCLLLSKVRNLRDPLRSAPKSHGISLSQSEAQNGSAPDPLSGGDRERIPCDSKADRWIDQMCYKSLTSCFLKLLGETCNSFGPLVPVFWISGAKLGEILAAVTQLVTSSHACV